MLKRSLLALLAVTCLLFCACSGSNEYKLKLAEDGKDNKDCIYYDDTRMVYVVGGIMMMEIDKESVMLETALYDGDVTITQILESAQKDADNGKIESTSYPDGSIEYHYENFNLVSLVHYGVFDVYFVPSSMGYNEVVG